MAAGKRSRKSPYRSKRRGRSVRGRKVKGLIAVLAVVLLGAGGYEYHTTGDIKQTVAIVESIPEVLSYVPGLVENVENATGWTIPVGKSSSVSSVSADEIPDYQGKDYVVLNDNDPDFSQEEKQSKAYEYYSSLDWLGRCGYAEAKIDRSLMPVSQREGIGSVKPTGWHTVKYRGVDGGYLYNRCHLIGYQLTGENANEKNLITGTRYFNVEGMLPWENMVTDYIKETGDAVMYRVTPVFENNDLVAKGVQMEAESVGGDDIQFNVFVYNIQPGIEIDYATGDSWAK